MARWKALPGGLEPAVVEFVGGLRSAKDASGLTLRRLAERTGYSTSSWERYLGGRLLPPREAVEALVAVAGTDPAPLLARYEMAADAWRRERPDDPLQPEHVPQVRSTPDRGTPVGATSALGASADVEPSSGGPADGGPTDGEAVAAARVVGDDARRARLRLLVTAVVSATVGATVAALVMLATQGSPPTGPARVSAPVAQPVSYACNYVRKAGLWYAGNSNSSTDALEVDKSGPAVAELQCLLQRAGFSPGGVDGNFGPLTESAVIRAQKAFGLDVDGQVGPHTWAALRG
ncbi:peptidoglycan-binding protein [Streptacidiphilus jiangxiensis]|uniref:Helix-turn-helix domain-containing protein n=1 Tax=Streptacidiphilus jiangxiensis TaxID=235985 RepID=A0A1H7ZZS9_STRJI|nr:peptidoglycan-binding protein [Streptacidiphilus jiangxiensis]SEM63831.1 Helix-turn-helix domain-containing protein [Streptacidiphilus jiangxiensis]